MKALLSSVMEGERLSRSEAKSAMNEILDGGICAEQLAAFLAALHTRRETAEELLGFLEVLREKAVPVPVKRGDLVDTCGTGGDNAGTLNISTAAGLVLAGEKIGVAKHGNRSVSSRCGSADVLEALGVPVALPPKAAATALDENHFAFLFAPLYHPALAAVAPVRKALGVRTVFNLLGPLANPARVKRQLVGVYHPALLSTYAELLRELGSLDAIVVCSEDGLDELSLTAPTRFARVKDGVITTGRLTPGDFGLERAPQEALRGGDPARNAQAVEGILSGELKGPKRDVVVMNAAAALVVAGAASCFKDGAAMASETIASGRALHALERAREAVA